MDELERRLLARSLLGDYCHLCWLWLEESFRETLGQNGDLTQRREEWVLYIVVTHGRLWDAKDVTDEAVFARLLCSP